jgi:hypothetical protein
MILVMIRGPDHVPILAVIRGPGFALTHGCHPGRTGAQSMGHTSGHDLIPGLGRGRIRCGTQG